MSEELKRLNEILNQLAVTVGKLDERVDMMLKYNDKLEDRVKHLEDKPDSAPLVERVDKIEGHLTWLNRLVIGAIIMQLIGLVLIKSI